MTVGRIGHRWVRLVLALGLAAGSLACKDEESSGGSTTGGGTTAGTTAGTTGDATGGGTGDVQGGEDTTGCPAGTKGCACLGDGTCTGELECTAGTCAEKAPCADGAKGCACYPNGTCDTGLSCTAGVCETAAAPGALGDACSASAPCGQHEGKPLECKDGTCRIPAAACTAGTLDCECKGDTSCDMHEGKQLVCNASGRCELPAACPVGTSGCPCDSGACQAGLVCQSGTCGALTGGGLTVSNAQVRACGFVFELQGAQVVFGSQVIGRVRRDGARVAVSFTAKADTAFTGPVVSVADAQGGPATVTPTKLECVDRHGAAVASPGLE